MLDDGRKVNRNIQSDVDRFYALLDKSYQDTSSAKKLRAKNVDRKNVGEIWVIAVTSFGGIHKHGIRTWLICKETEQNLSIFSTLYMVSK